MPLKQLSSNQASTDFDLRELQNVHPQDWKNPEPLERYHFLVIGAGPAGLMTALNAAKLGAKVAIIERDRFGGACFNVGCIPSKTIIRTSRLYAEMRNAENFGAQVPAGISMDFPAVMERMRRVRARISRRVSAQRLSTAGVDVYFGASALCRTRRRRGRGKTFALQARSCLQRCPPETSFDSRNRRSRLPHQ